MKKSKLKVFNEWFSRPVMAMMFGYGFFWLYMQSYHNVWLAMFVGGYASIIVYKVWFSK